MLQIIQVTETHFEIARVPQPSSCVSAVGILDVLFSRSTIVRMHERNPIKKLLVRGRFRFQV